jgi:ribosome-associated heat shock protein Hsp15
MSQEIRIDKYLWMVRLFKTRSKAAEACRRDRVRINGKNAKPAQSLKPGDQVEVKFIPIWRSYEVIGFPKSRVGAALLPEYLTETTTDEEQAKYKEYQLVQRDQFIYSPSKGRPTKRDRRNIDRFKDDE